MRGRGDSLRMHGRTDHDVQVSLPRLPARDRRRIRAWFPGSGIGLSPNERTIALPFHAERQGRKHRRGFCAECGSRITGGESHPEASEFVGILARSLDDPSWFKPELDFFVSDAQPWDQMDPAIPKFQDYPPPPGNKRKCAGVMIISICECLDLLT